MTGEPLGIPANKLEAINQTLAEADQTSLDFDESLNATEVFVGTQQAFEALTKLVVSI